MVEGVGGGGGLWVIIKEAVSAHQPGSVSGVTRPSLQPLLSSPRRHKAADLAQSHVTAELLPSRRLGGLCNRMRQKKASWLHFSGGWRGEQGR